MNMNYSVCYNPSLPPSASPYRLLDDQGHELVWANSFLDAQRLRRLSLRSLRAYAYDLLHFARWSQLPLAKLTETTLLEYVRYQQDQQPQPAPQTVNHRLTVLHCLYRFHQHCELPSGSAHLQRTCPTRSSLGYGRPGHATVWRLRLKQPQRLVVPLSDKQVDRFWSSFRVFRDLAMVGLMVLDGLRSAEVLALRLEDFQAASAQLRVSGKGDKQRLLPLPQDLIDALNHYLQLERPRSTSNALFVCLKGPHRGQPLTLAGLRALFRYHRTVSHEPSANPHRFRHTFGAEMVRAGISLPALQQLMGHAQIRTTMLYVHLAPRDVWAEYTRALQKRKKTMTSDSCI
jgi:site-specific recombinase XerD